MASPIVTFAYPISCNESLMKKKQSIDNEEEDLQLLSSLYSPLAQRKAKCRGRKIEKRSFDKELKKKSRPFQAVCILICEWVKPTSLNFFKLSATFANSRSKIQLDKYFQPVLDRVRRRGERFSGGVSNSNRTLLERAPNRACVSRRNRVPPEVEKRLIGLRRALRRLSRGFPIFAAIPTCRDPRFEVECREMPL